MSVMEIEEVLKRTRELERMFPGLKTAWETAWDLDYNWKEMASDYEAYRTFVLRIGDTPE